jgi:hypothetical protein
MTQRNNITNEAIRRAAEIQLRAMEQLGNQYTSPPGTDATPTRITIKELERYFAK